MRCWPSAPRTTLTPRYGVSQAAGHALTLTPHVDAARPRGTLTPHVDAARPRSTPTQHAHSALTARRSRAWLPFVPTRLPSFATTITISHYENDDHRIF